MARRRLQKNGDLYQQGGYWKLRWKEDRLDENGAVTRGWSKPVWLGPCEGNARLTTKEAQRIAWESFLSRMDQNNVTPMSMITLREFIERKFIPEHVAMLKKAGQIHYGVRSEKTGEYGGMLRHILPTLGHFQLRDVTVSDLQNFVSTLRVERRKRMGKQLMVSRHPASVQTKLHMKNALSAIFEHAIDIEWASRNPAKKIKLPEMQRKPNHALSFSQATTLLEALASPAREMALCSMLTSMNVAEICGLLWKDINLSNEWVVSDGDAIQPMTLLVRQQWRLGEYTSLKEKPRERPIPIARALAEAFAKLNSRGRFVGPDDPVFAVRHDAVANDVVQLLLLNLPVLRMEKAHEKIGGRFGGARFQPEDAAYPERPVLRAGGKIPRPETDLSLFLDQLEEFVRRKRPAA